MEQDDLMALSRKLDELLRTEEDPREALLELVREHRPKRTMEEARIVFGSSRTRIDTVEEMPRQVLAEYCASE